VITAVNPAYTAPADFKFAKLLERVPNSIYFTLYEDETAAACKVVVPAAHALETWSDVRATDGTVSIVQPLIAPLWGGAQEADLCAAFLDEGDVGANKLLRRYWQGQFTRGRGLRRPLGTLAGRRHRSRYRRRGRGRRNGRRRRAGADGRAPAGAHQAGLELAFVADPKLYDGRFANNAWLQELPHPITKLTWDNAAMLSETTAKSLQLETGDIVEVSYGDRRVDAPVMIVPGHVDDTVTLPLGYGRTAAGTGSVGKDVGFNAGALRTSDNPWYDRGATLAKTGRRFKFAITQDHWTMSPDGRVIPPPAVEAPIAEVLKRDSKFNEEIETRRGPLPTIHEPVDYSKQPYKWAMSIDLNKCTGCNACVVACSAENNITGRRQGQRLAAAARCSGSASTATSRQRDTRSMITQPLMCVHCETAPCEYVCPVNATVHSDEGLNEMVYNRCIGTRYCSNNCPTRSPLQLSQLHRRLHGGA
jgi:molybdopterin-containing oxidoreductase family iron-sulfur binding subunit